MRSRFLFLLILFTLPQFSKADGGRGTYIWPEYKGITVPDSLKSEAAFFIQNMTTIDFMSSFETQIVVFKRVYINSEEAAEKYSKKELIVGNSGTITMIAARTLKNSGEILELGKEDILETFTKTRNKYGRETVKKIQLIYPQVQVGDVLDFAYQIDLDGFIYSDMLYLEDEIPSMHTRISLRNMTDVLDLTAYSVNGIPKMITSNSGGIKTAYWEKKGVSSIKTDFFNAISPKHPYLVYTLWKPSEDMDYKTIFEYETMTFPYNYGGFTSLTEYFIEQGIFKEEDESFVRLKKIISYLDQECTWNRDKGTKYVKESINFLKKKKVDAVLFQRYIMKFLFENRMAYEQGFTKSLRDGFFEHGFVSLEQLSHRFLIIYDAEENGHFLFPPRGENLFYFLDEIPYYLEGNQSIAIKSEKNALKDQFAVLLPESPGKMNRHKASIVMKLDKDLGATMKRKDRLNGHYSFLTRGGYSSIWLDELRIAPDSVEIEPASVQGYYPYKTEYAQSDLTFDGFQKFGDSLVWFDPSDLLPMGVYQDNEADEELGNYVVLPFLKQTEIAVFIQSESPISIAEDEKEIAYSNSIGEVKAKISKADDTVLKATFSVETKKRYLDNEADIKAFEELLQKYAEISKKKWLLSVQSQ